MNRFNALLVLILSLPSLSFAAWEATYVDNFDGNTLAIDKWVRGQANLDRQLQSYRDEAIVVNDGNLELQIINKPYSNRPYVAGAVTTQGIFAQKYGYFEVRAKMAKGHGLWPAFWLMPETGSWTSEIDIFEFIGNSHGVHNAFHHDWRAQNQNGSTTTVTDRDLSKTFNTYALQWSPHRIQYLMNGKVIHQITDTAVIAKADKPMFVMLNTALASQHTGWISNVNATTDFSETFTVDYVRVFKERAGGAFATIPSSSVFVANTQNAAYDNVAISVESLDEADATPAINRTVTSIRDKVRLTAHAAANAKVWIALHKATRFYNDGRYDAQKLQVLERDVHFNAAGETEDIAFEFSDVTMQPGLYHVDITIRDNQAGNSNQSASRYKSYEFLNSNPSAGQQFDAYIRSASATTGQDGRLRARVALQLQEAALTPFLNVDYKVVNKVTKQVVLSETQRVNHEKIGAISLRHTLAKAVPVSDQYELHVIVSDADRQNSTAVITGSVSSKVPPEPVNMEIR